MSVNSIKKSLISLVIKEINNGNWDKLTIDYMSKKLKTPSKKILEVCTSKHNLLDLWSEDINQEMLKNISKDELKEVSIKERLLELMLCRFDALSNRKKETNAFVKLSKLNIKESKNSIFRVYKAMELICNYAGITIKGPKGLLKLKGLVVIWIIVFMDWQKHGMDNEDILLSKLDKNLSYAEKFKNTFIN